MNVDIVRGRWFKSFEDFDEELSERLRKAHLTAYENAFPVTVLYLSWAGLNYDEMAALKKSEISSLHNANEKILSFAAAHASMRIHPSDENFDGYLLRSRDMAQSNYDAISARVSRFNKALETDKPTFMPSCIHESGVYSRIIQNNTFLPRYGKNRPVTKRAWVIYESAFERKFNNVRQITNTMERFNEWKKMFGLT